MSLLTNGCNFTNRPFGYGGKKKKKKLLLFFSSSSFICSFQPFQMQNAVSLQTRDLCFVSFLMSYLLSFTFFFSNIIYFSKQIEKQSSLRCDTLIEPVSLYFWILECRMNRIPTNKRPPLTYTVKV